MDKLLEREQKAQAVIKQMPQYRYEYLSDEMSYMFYYDDEHIGIGIFCEILDDCSVEQLCNAINAKYQEVSNLTPLQKQKQRKSNLREVRRRMSHLTFELYESDGVLLVLDNVNRKGIQMDLELLEIPPSDAAKEIQAALDSYTP